jgi:hypothetical protein
MGRPYGAVLALGAGDRPGNANARKGLARAPRPYRRGPARAYVKGRYGAPRQNFVRRTTKISLDISPARSYKRATERPGRGSP